VIVSGYDCPLYAEIYQGWRTERRKSLADGAREREETLWFSPNVPKHHDLFQEGSALSTPPADRELFPPISLASRAQGG
jgi:hypothetical protein